MSEWLTVQCAECDRTGDACGDEAVEVLIDLGWGRNEKDFLWRCPSHSRKRPRILFAECDLCGERAIVPEGPGRVDSRLRTIGWGRRHKRPEGGWGPRYCASCGTTQSTAVLAREAAWLLGGGVGVEQMVKAIGRPARTIWAALEEHGYIKWSLAVRSWDERMREDQ